MFKLKKRCLRCLHVLREDGTCQNPDCVRYKPKETKAEADKDKAKKDGR